MKERIKDYRKRKEGRKEKRINSQTKSLEIG
jgi:hypothetical protein